MERKDYLKCKVTVLAFKEAIGGDEEQFADVFMRNKTEFSKPIGKCREAFKSGNKELYDERKGEQPAFTPSVRLAGGRTQNHIAEYTGILVLDFDKLGDKLPTVREKIEKYPYTFGCILSPSGNGLKVFVKVDSDLAEHKFAFEKVKGMYERLTKAKIDDSGSDPTRLCFFSADDNLCWKPKSKVVPIKPKEEIQTDSKNLEQNMSIPTDFSTLSRTLDNILSFLERKKLSLTSSYEDWRNVAFGLLNSIDDKKVALDYFHQFSRRDENYKKDNCDQEWEKLYKTKENDGKKITVASMIYRAKELGFNIQKEQKEWLKFWRIVPKKKIEDGYDIIINMTDVMNFWSMKGYIRLKMYGSPTLALVRNNRVVEATYDDMRQCMTEHIKHNVPENLGNNLTKKDLLEIVLNQTNKLIGNNIFGHMNTIKTNIHWDTEDTSYFYFNNGVVAVTADNIKLIPYKDFEGVIWEDGIKKHDIDLENFDKSVFKTFMEKIVGIEDGSERLLALETAMGYLLHRYKNPSNSKAVIFLDEGSENDIANGGTGKTLLLDGIGKMRTVVTIDGRMKEDNSKFKFMEVDRNTELVLIDDIKQKFNFTTLYTAISGELKVEKKSENIVKFPFSKFIKIAFTSNYLPEKSTEGSTKRRLVEVEINHYFSHRYRPVDEFEKTFFENWNNSEWNDFYVLMIKLVQKYLKHGITTYDKTNLKKKQLVKDLGEPFVKFFDKELKTKYVNYNLKELKEKFNTRNDEIRVDAQIFNRKLRTYVEAKGLNTEGYTKPNNMNKPWIEKGGKYILMIID